MKNTMTKSLRILSFSWGKMEVELLGRGKDFKLWVGGGRPWDWAEHGTSHGRGVQPGDVEELIEHGCRVIIFTTGRLNRLKENPETVRVVRNKGVEVKVVGTKEGVRLYNEYVEKGVAVGGLFHSTC